MNHTLFARTLLVTLLAAAAASAAAKATPDEIARLGKDLTPVGAEQAANKDGSIPAWSGGLAKPPAGFDPAKGLLDPYAADKPLYTITAANAEQHKDKLAPGHLALLKAHPSYKMVVYPSRRSAAYPQSVYDAVKAEAGAADTANNGNSVVNVVRSHVPFPLPKSGVEVIWNNAMRHSGPSLVRHTTRFPVQANGSFTPTRNTQHALFASSMKAPPANIFRFYKTRTTAPSNLAGEAVLVIDSVDMVKGPRKSWVYSPGSRRVLRAPEVAFDTPLPGSDALATTDDYDGFNGSPERFDFKLVGKREMLIAYNNHRLTDKSLKYNQIARAGTVNQDLVRYELHRVWVVEATLRKGASHVYGKRVYFIDEDSWQIAHGDLYDGRGELWRVYETFSVQHYDAPVLFTAGSVQYDLQARRYLLNDFTNEEKPITWGVALSEADFSTGALKQD